MTDSIATFETNIVPELLPLAKPIGEATPHPDNIRRHDIPRIARSLRAHGQRSAIVVQASTGFIVKGNGTWEAARRMGWDQIAVSVQEMDDDAAMAYLIADNRASDKASYDRDKTVAALAKLEAGPGLFDTLWELDEFEDLVAEGGDVPTTTPEEFKGDYADGGALLAKGEAEAMEPSKPGQKMKEVPIIVTAAEHALFIENVRRLMKVYGIKNARDTILEAVRREATNEAAVVATGDSEEIRVATLKAARDHFLTKGQPTYTIAEVAAFFQSAMTSMRPADAPTDVVPGQMGFLDLTGADPGAATGLVDDEAALAAENDALSADSEAALAADELVI